MSIFKSTANGRVSTVLAVAIATMALVVGGGPRWVEGQVILPESRLMPENVSPSPTSLAGAPVVQVRVMGRQHVAKMDVDRHIQTRAGRPYDAEMVEEDVRRLTRTGMFVRVKPYTQRVEGGCVVIYEIVERPIVQYVKYVGNESIHKRRLAKEAEDAKLAVGMPADPFAVNEARRLILSYYQTHGFPSARVTIFEGDKPEDRGVVFLINEGVRQRILWTNFIGNTIVRDDRLRTQIQSKHGFLWLFQGYVDRDKIDQDIKRLTAYYRGLGFFRARIGRRMDYDKKWLTLTFVIDEGPRYRVRNVRCEGNKEFTDEHLRSMLELTEGEYFQQAEMQEDLSALRDEYGGIGHIFADIETESLFFEEPGMLDLVYHIDEGRQYRVGRIDVDIRGEFPHTQLTTVLNRMSLYPGDIIDIRQLRASERRLRASRIFEVDPSKGAPPQIVFSAPDNLADVEELAGRTGPSSGRFRGQSPDDQGDAYVNLTLLGRTWGSQSDTRTRRTIASPARGTSPRNEGRDWQQPAGGTYPTVGGSRPVASQHPSPAGIPLGSAAQDLIRSLDQAPPRPTSASQPRPSFLGDVPPGSGLVVRGQSYSSEGGRSVPSVNDDPLFPRGPLDETHPRVDSGLVVGADGLYGSSSSNEVEQTQYLPDERIPGVSGLLGRSPYEAPPVFIPLEPTVAETRTGKFMFSVGVNSDAGMMGSIILDEQNFNLLRWPRGWYDFTNGKAFRGGGQRFRIEAVPGTRFHRYTASLQEPYLFHTNAGRAVGLTLSGHYYTRSYREWNEERLGGRIGLGLQLTPDLSVAGSFRGSRVSIYEPIMAGIPELDEAVGHNALYGFGAKLVHDTRDSAFLPTEGHLIEIGAEQVIGTHQYTRANLDVRKYFMLHQRPDRSGRHVLALNARVGVTGDDTPIYEHYFIGGFTTIRGFDFREASPRKSGVVIGGHHQLLASAEYMFPITADDMLRGVIFCDTGTVEPSIDDWTDRYRISPGFGLRITIPAMGPAPIALDLAFPIQREDGDGIQNFSFFVGFLR